MIDAMATLAMANGATISTTRLMENVDFIPKLSEKRWLVRFARPWLFAGRLWGSNGWRARENSTVRGGNTHKQGKQG
jgi:hypothetical protein